jgi:hypothetical protein
MTANLQPNTIMKSKTILSITAGMLLIGSLDAAPGVNLSGVATTNATSVILDVYADPGSFELRSFGIRVLFDPADLALQTADHCDGLWFLEGGGGSRFAYGPPSEVSPGAVRVVGGRFSALNPADGLNSSRLLLATLVFDRLNANTPDFSFGLASPAPFANFVTTEGDTLDAGVAGFTGTVTQQATSADTDGDGLPDTYEISVFGDLTTSDGTTDTDGDGVSDADEWQAGTDPADSASRLQLRLSVLPSGVAVLDWDSVLGRIYTVEWSDSPTGFGIAVGGIPATPARNQIQAMGFGDHDRIFYRLAVENPSQGR